jgi:hypothetical protein
MMADVNEGATKTLDQSGYFTGWYEDPPGTLNWLKIPISDLKNVKDQATLALKPSDVGDMAYANSADFQSTEDAAIAYNALNVELQVALARIVALESLIGISGIVVFDADVFEPGVFN